MDDNDFFTVDGSALICKTHAAMYEPETGECFAGPCQGRSLDPLDIDTAAGVIVLSGPPA
jgi:nitrite reductase/ring-hydroxylating ferredoxin subunit